MKVKVAAYAKINLMLDIVSLRTDGYHDLFMIMQSVGVHDIVTVSENKSRKISITCAEEGIPLDESNICWKAAKGFFKYTKKRNKGINIDIQKKIPHAAGLAGGSADGAAVIKALNEIYCTELSDKKCVKSALKSAQIFRFALRAALCLLRA